MTPSFNRLVALYTRALEVQDRANAQAHAADDALAGGYLMAAEQHYAFSRAYRQEAAQRWQELKRYETTLAEFARVAQLEVCRRLYGSAEAARRPYVE